jgi:hypothetical protein
VAQLVLQVAISVAVSYAASFVLGKLAKSDADSARIDASAGREVSPAPLSVDPLAVAPDPGGALPGLFGYRRIGGKVKLSAKSGNRSYLVIVLAGSPVAGFAGSYLNNSLVTTDASGNVLSRPWANPAGASGINIRLYDGTQTTVDPELDAAFPGWTANHVGRGIAYARILMDPSVDAAYFDDVLNSAPDFTFGVLGFKCYDPRQPGHVLGNPATYSWSNNVSICRANYFIHELGMRRPASAVDWATVAASANIDDGAVALAGGGAERRYTCAAYWMTDQRHEDVLSKFDAANGGTFGPVGDRWRSTSGAWVAPSATIVPDDYEADGLTFADFTPISSSVNGVRGTFASPLHNYEMRDFPPYQDTIEAGIDAGGLGVSIAAAASWLDRSYEFVTSASQAQRLARIDYYRARFGFSANVALNFSHFDTIAGDTVLITDPLAGFANTEFRVASDSLDADWTVRLELTREGEGFYAWNPATDEKPFVASAPLLGEPGGLKPPGFALADNTGGTSVGAFMWFWPSPSAGWDVYVLNRGAGSADQTFSASAPTSTVQPLGSTSVAINWSLRVRNSATGEESPAQSVSTTSGAIQDATITTTTQFRLPAANTPVIRALNSGNAQLDILATSAARCDQLVVYSNSTNDFATATATHFLGNSNQILGVTGSFGTVRYYWTVARNIAANALGPASSPVVVVF